VVLGTYDPTTIKPPTGGSDGEASGRMSFLVSRGLGGSPLLVATKEAAVRKMSGGGGIAEDSL
jgi:hypothetical protein